MPIVQRVAFVPPGLPNNEWEPKQNTQPFFSLLFAPSHRLQVFHKRFDHLKKRKKTQKFLNILAR
jgi:hypothetical protein